MTETKHLTEVEKNFAVFQRMLPELLNSHPGKFVVLHDGEVVDFFDTLRDAVRFGAAKFGDQNFSIQEITRKTINLGYHSYALNHHPY